MVPNLAEVVQGSPKSEGCSATFVSINETWGLKYWESSRKAGDNYRMNKLAAEFGLAPKVGEMVTFKLPNTPDSWDDREEIEYHGYFVEKIEMTYQQRFYREDDSWWETTEDSEGNWDYVVPRINNSLDFERLDLPNLPAMLQEVGFDEVEDLHWANVGWLPDGRFVCIDFDHCTLADIENGDLDDLVE